MRGSGVWRFARACVRVFFSLLPAGLLGCGGGAQQDEPRDQVVLIHGLRRTDLSMIRMEKALEENGYDVVNVGYSSTDHVIEHLATEELAPAMAVRSSAVGEDSDDASFAGLHLSVLNIMDADSMMPTKVHSVAWPHKAQYPYCN